MGVSLSHSFNGHGEMRAGLVEAELIQRLEQLASPPVELAKFVPALLQLCLLGHPALSSAPVVDWG